MESSDRNDSPNGSVPFFCRGPSLPAFSVPDCDESGRKWLPLFKSYVLTKPKLQWTENKQAQFMKKYTDYSSPSYHSSDSKAIATALKVDSPF